jgi:hypothetical protein
MSLSRLAVAGRVDARRSQKCQNMMRHKNGRKSTSGKEGDQEETRHMVIACVPSEY